MIGTIVKIKNNTPVMGIVIKQADDLRYWRVLGMNDLRWYELRLDNPYVEVVSESR